MNCVGTVKTDFWLCYILPNRIFTVSFQEWIEFEEIGDLEEKGEDCLFPIHPYETLT